MGFVALVLAVLGWVCVVARRPGVGRLLFYIAVLFGVIALVLNHC